MAPPYTTGLVLSLDAALGVYKDAAKSSAASVAGDLVYTWADQSGSGNDVVQATSGSRPTYQPSTLNSLPVIRSTGAGYLSNASFTWNAQSETLFIVFAPRARNVQQVLASQSNSLYWHFINAQPNTHDTTDHAVASAASHKAATFR